MIRQSVDIKAAFVRTKGEYENLLQRYKIAFGYANFDAKVWQILASVQKITYLCAEIE